jgi:hypothetical protein
MSINYDVRLYTPDGTFLTSLGNIIDAENAGLDYALRSDGGIGALTLTVPQGDLDVYFNWQNVDYKIGVWRSINGAPYVLDNDAMFFIRKFEYFRGYTRLTAYHALELLTRRLNGYRKINGKGSILPLKNNWGPQQAGTSISDIEGAGFVLGYAGNLMKGIVRQNYSFDQASSASVGTFGLFNTDKRINATIANKNNTAAGAWDVNLNLPNLNLQQYILIEPDTNDGISKAGIQCDMGVVHNLLKQLQELSTKGDESDNTAPVYLTFDLKAVNERQFIFQTFANSYGKNRGRGEFVFSMARGNLAQASMVVDRSEESTVMYSIDKDENIRAAVNRRRLNDSPFNLREALSIPEIKDKYYKNPRTTINAWVMQGNDAVEELTKKTTRIKIEGSAVPTPSSIRGVHWDLGDIVTVDFRGYRDDYRITAVNVTINSGNVEEKIQWEQVNLYGLGKDASDEISP